NGEYLPETEAKVSVFDRGFLFADGIYEVSAVIDGRLIDNNAHHARLRRSCGEIGLALPWSDDEITAIQHELITRNKIDEGGLYMQVTRGSAERDFAFPKDAKPSLVMFTQARNLTDTPQARTGIRVITVPDLRWKRRDIKSVALLAQVLAKQAAAEAGAQEAWMVEDGFVTEGGSSTSWIVTADRKLVSRPLSNAVLPGITRKALLTLLEEEAKGEGLIFEERAFTVEEALGASEAFITAASSLVMPVVEIDGHRIGGGQPGPISRRLREIYLDTAKHGGPLG
ncbi:MAG: D-amino-acid transaminase, partial [Bosea sp. (in: a-proteobacteria)]